ncbi:MAG: sugar-binding protein [Armatimonadota bacterium]
MSRGSEVALELPARSLFAFTFQCHRRARPPRVDGRLTDWPAKYRLPDISALDGRRPFAQVYVSWNEEGLHFACRVDGKRRVETDRDRWWRKDCLEVWLDMRDNRTIHRATRFCHQFCFIPQSPEGRRNSAEGWQVPIHRALEQAPQCDPEQLQVAAVTGKTFYCLEIVLPSEVLFGFDPEVCSRLGFAYHINDAQLGQQSATVGKEFPIHSDPGLWATLELVR